PVGQVFGPAGVAGRDVTARDIVVGGIDDRARYRRVGYRDVAQLLTDAVDAIQHSEAVDVPDYLDIWRGDPGGRWRRGRGGAGSHRWRGRWGWPARAAEDGESIASIAGREG